MTGKRSLTSGHRNRSRLRRAIGSDERGVSPVVEKLLVTGIVVLYVGGMGTILFGGVVPSYETQANDEVSERVLSTAAAGIEGAVPETDNYVESRTVIDLPGTIGDSAYRLVIADQSIELVHPERGIGAETRLSIPPEMTVQPAEWHSGSNLVIEVQGQRGERTLTIGEKE